MGLKNQTYTVASSSKRGRLGFNAENQIIFGTVSYRYTAHYDSEHSVQYKRKSPKPVKCCMYILSAKNSVVDGVFRGILTKVSKN